MPAPRPWRRTARRASAAVDELARYLRTETIGGAVMLVAALAALIWVNSPVGDSYTALRDLRVGPSAIHLDLDLATWAADGLLAVFFFVAGLELKRELVVGELRVPRTALLPVFAALGGMIVPAVLAVLVMSGATGSDRAWAIPVATDIAFALAVLAVAGRSLPRSLRLFLLSLAVVDDLGAILLIAVLFTATISIPAFGAAAALIAAYGWLQHRRVRSAWLYVPLALATWVAVHESGVHATVAGMALALLTRVRPDPDEAEAPAARLEHRLQPWSAGLCVPLFALLAAGVSVSGDSLRGIVDSPIALGVVVGLLVGKTVGVFGGALVAVRLRLATMPADLHWGQIAAVAVLGGVGFTVSLLVTELSFDDDALTDQVKTAVLVASTIAAVAGAALLRTPRVRREPPGTTGPRPAGSAGPEVDGRGP